MPEKSLLATSIVGLTPDPSGTRPAVSALEQNYPNPFNPTTTIQYGLPETGWVSLKIYDLRGEEVTILVNSKQEAGWYSVIWDGKDYSGRSVGSGGYFYRLVAGGNLQTQKMVLMKWTAE